MKNLTSRKKKSYKKINNRNQRKNYIIKFLLKKILIMLLIMKILITLIIFLKNKFKKIIFTVKLKKFKIKMNFKLT